MLSTGALKFGELGREAFDKLKNSFVTLVENVLGLKEEKPANVEGILGIVIELYKQAQAAKDYAKLAQIRAGLKQYGVVLKDMQQSVGWAYEE